MTEPLMKIDDAVHEINKAGLTAIVQPNNSGDRKPNHIKIVGGLRHVEFWTTTLTVFANKTASLSQVKGRGIDLAIKIAKRGY